MHSSDFCMVSNFEVDRGKGLVLVSITPLSSLLFVWCS